MDRRAFIGSLIGGVALAAARAWPFRVYSFPTELRIFSMNELRCIYVERAMAEIDRAIAEMAELGTHFFLRQLGRHLPSEGSTLIAI